jgi:hypothetical protein
MAGQTTPLTECFAFVGIFLHKLRVAFTGIAMMAGTRGVHYCAGVATSITETIFRYLNSRCAAAGGLLSTTDIEAARTHFLGSLPGAFNFFETVNESCMAASGCTGVAPFARDNILAALLQACGHKAARSAFPAPVGRFGDPWFEQFFGGVAQFIRARVCRDADARLIKVYAELAPKIGAKLTIADLLKDDGIRAVMRTCVAPFMVPDASMTLAADVSDTVSQHIAEKRGIPKPDISKVTEQETRNFLAWLPAQLHLALSGASQPRHAAAG